MAEGLLHVRRVPLPHQALGALQGGQQALVMPSFVEGEGAALPVL